MPKKYPPVFKTNGMEKQTKARTSKRQTLIIAEETVEDIFQQSSYLIPY